MRKIDEALEKGEDVTDLLNDFREEGVPNLRKPNPTAVAEHLEEIGVSTITAARVKDSFRLSTKKKGPEFERLSHLRAEVATLADGIEEVFHDQAPKIISGEIEDEPTAEELAI